MQLNTAQAQPWGTLIEAFPVIGIDLQPTSEKCLRIQWNEILNHAKGILSDLDFRLLKFDGNPAATLSSCAPEAVMPMTLSCQPTGPSVLAKSVLR